MKKLTYTVKITAPVRVVWETMLEDETYRDWTGAFHEGSYFEGGWEAGDPIRFLGPNDDGTMGGMIGVIERSEPQRFVSVRYLGQVEKGVDDLDSEQAKLIAGSHENYTFSEDDGVTTVLVELDSDEQFVEMFDEMWPLALARLKEIAEERAGA
ncbi:uncharacterized protein YndB with AHSA1/START domain [Conyzicola nivalis]|uniref:Uncharacterized protein YndB with AHSA1/START domain n=1 Tax=Conyzicola nivalis TaxID=1477021 RepID=A0ABV2QKF3_9MICO